MATKRPTAGFGISPAREHLPERFEADLDEAGLDPATEPSPQNPDPDGLRLLSIAQVADLFSVTKRTVWNWIKAGTLHPVRTSRRSVFIRADEIDQLCGIQPDGE